MKKISKMNELAWVFGILFCTLGICLCTKANFGLSMIAAPPYILHLRMVEIFPWWSQGTSEYIWQGFLLLLLWVLMRRVKIKFILCFVTAVLFGFALDGWFVVFGGNGAYESMLARIISFVLGESITTLAVAFYFKTDMPLQIYELLVTQLAPVWNCSISRLKQINDIAMFVISVVLALALTGGFHGVGIGTVVITIVNAPLIKMFSNLLDRLFTFEPRFPKLVEKLKL